MSRDLFGVAAFVLTGVVLVIQLSRLRSLRRQKVSVAALLMAGPMLFLHPDRYFRDDHLSAPWRMLLWFVLWIGVVAVVGAWFQV
jgi:O-antigen/teichoic acid export membrane protein